MKAVSTTCSLGVLFVSAALAQPTPGHIVANHRSFFPKGDGPFPTVVAIPGCSGVSLDGPATDEGRPGDEADRLFRRHYARMAERLRDAGFGVVLVDYLTAEGVANTCSGEIPHQRVGEYVAASLEFVRSLPQLDPSRLYVIGWSHGGAGVIAWLQSLGVETPRPVAGAVAVYPGCGSRDVWVSDVPVLVVLGEADDITPPERCDEILTRLPGSTRVEVRRYANARHGFDFTEGPEVLPIGGGMTVGRNSKAGDEAWKEIFAFLEATPRPTLGEIEFPVLEELSARAPRRPGVLHYLIHAYDHPLLAERAGIPSWTGQRIRPCQFGRKPRAK